MRFGRARWRAHFAVHTIASREGAGCKLQELPLLTGRRPGLVYAPSTPRTARVPPRHGATQTTVQCNGATADLRGRRCTPQAVSSCSPTASATGTGSGTGTAAVAVALPLPVPLPLALSGCQLEVPMMHNRPPRIKTDERM